MSSRSREPVDRAAAGLGRLRSAGPDGLERARVVEIQRARLLGAMVQVACEHGAGNVTVAHVVERAGVSRRTFYEIFTDGEDCLMAALEDALGHASARVLPLWRSAGGWRERVRGCLVALLGLFDQEPALARLLLVESLAAGRMALERCEWVLAKLIGAIEQGAAGEDRKGTGRLRAEGAIGGVLAVLHARIAGEQHSRLLELAGPLMSMIVLPYRGAGAARRELDRPLPASTGARGETPLRSDPFKDAGMRLTYRTVRVLSAIAERPHASNRLIGQCAGIKDQGQISKLLARLQQIGLVSNTGLGPGQGAPNAWTLTPAGRQVAQRIHAHSEDSEHATEGIEHATGGTERETGSER